MGPPETDDQPAREPFDFAAGYEEMWFAHWDACKALERVTSALDRQIRLFNRLDAAVTHHEQADRFKEDHDEALYAARARILKDAAQEPPEREGRSW